MGVTDPGGDLGGHVAGAIRDAAMGVDPFAFIEIQRIFPGATYAAMLAALPFVKDRGALIDVLGGNQSDAVNVKGYQAAALLGIRRPPKAQVKKTAKTEHEPPVMSKKAPVSDTRPSAQPAQSEVATPPPSPAKTGGGAVAALVGGALVLIGAKIDALTAWASEWAHWAASFFN